MDHASIFMLAVFGLGVVSGAAFPRSRWAMALPLLVPIGFTAVPILRDPKAGEAFLFVAPFLVAIVLVYGVISYAGFATGRALRQRMAPGRGAEADKNE